MSNLSSQRLSQQFGGDQWPEFLAATEDQQTFLLDLRIDPSITWFGGHFPGQPVLPGIVQTHWAASFGQYLFALTDAFSQVQNLKFQTMILPNITLTLKLQMAPNGRGVKFVYFHEQTVFSEGRLDFAVE